MIAAIAAKEGRVVKTLDFTAAYLNARMPPDKEVLIRIPADVVPFFLVAKPEWAEFVTDDGSMTMKLDRPLYECIESGKLWYDLLSSTLVRIGFEADPCDQCVSTSSWMGFK